MAEVSELAGPLDAENTAAQHERIRPRQFQWQHEMKDGRMRYVFAGQSFTVIRIQ